jgi:hypothetical protein
MINLVASSYRCGDRCGIAKVSADVLKGYSADRTGVAAGLDDNPELVTVTGQPPDEVGS